MPQIIKARVERDGSIHLLEAVRLAQPVEVEIALPTEALVETERDIAALTGLADIRAKRLAWMKSDANREQHGGQYVALAGDELVATGRTMREARDAARGAGKTQVFVTYLSKPDETAEMGGWL